MSGKIKIALLGCGTVGSGVVTILNRLNNPNIELVKILVRNDKRADEISKALGISRKLFTSNVNEIINDPEINIVVELMGQVANTKQSY